MLIAIAARLRGHVRGGDSVARLGGDEFVVILLAPVDQREAILVAERLIAAVSAPFTLAAGTATVTAGVGIALSSPDCADPEALLASADATMYAAMQDGKGRYALAGAMRVAGV